LTLAEIQAAWLRAPDVVVLRCRLLALVMMLGRQRARQGGSA
jgi:hypothetical protein